MKHPVTSLYKKQIYTFFFLFIITLLIWFGGPLITVADTFPFKTVEKRLYIIAIFYLAWILKFFLLDLMPDNASQKNPPALSEIEKKIAHLKGKFEGAIEFLKKTVIEKHGSKINLSHLPWYVVIGPKESGKTSLLAKSSIHFILAKQSKDKPLSTSETCDWWVTRDIVFVDVPGSYFHIPHKNTESTQLWRYFLSLIKKCHKNKSAPGILIALNLPQLIREERTKKNQVVYDLKKRLIELSHTLNKPLPIHIVITKCDLLTGFNDFFGEGSRDEFMQPW